MSVIVKVTWEDILIKVSNLREEVIKESKRVLKRQVPKSESVRNQVRDNLLTLYNNFVSTVNSCYTDIDDSKYNNQIKPIFNIIRDRVIRSYQVLQVDYKIPTNILKKIDPRVKDELILIDITEDITRQNDDSDSDSDSNNELQVKKDQENLTNFNMPLSAPEFFNLASKIVPAEFDGSEDKLTSFLDALTLLKANVETHEGNAVAYVKTRLTGKARSIVGESTTLEEINLKLKNGIKSESSQSVTSKLLNLKQRYNDTKYVTEIESLTHKLKQAYISEGVPENVAENYTTNTTVKALSANATSEKVKIIMEAGNFHTVQEAVQKFVNVSAENAASATVLYTNRGQNRGRPRNNYRGRRTFEYRGRNSSYSDRNNNAQYTGNASNFYWRPNQQNRGFPHRGRPFRPYRPYRHVRAYDAEQNQENQEEPQQGPLGHS